MKKLIFLLCFIKISSLMYSQNYVTLFYDRRNFAIVQENHLMRMTSEMQFENITRKSNDYFTDANKNLAKFLVAKKKVHDALLNVNSAFKNCLQVKQIAKQIDDIFKNIDGLRAEIALEPQYSVFVRSYINNLVYHSLALSEMVTNIALTGGENNILMNYQQRDALLRDVSSRLHIINANLSLMRQHIYFAKADGFWKSVNPFKDWIAQDRRIVGDIIRRSKYLGL